MQNSFSLASFRWIFNLRLPKMLAALTTALIMTGQLYAATNPEPCTEPYQCILNPQLIGALETGPKQIACHLVKNTSWTIADSVVLGLKVKCGETPVPFALKNISWIWTITGPEGEKSGVGKSAAWGADHPPLGVYKIVWSGRADHDDADCPGVRSALVSFDYTVVEEWDCVSHAWVNEVTITGPTKLLPGVQGTWIATAKTSDGQFVSLCTGLGNLCPVKEVRWSMTAGAVTSNTNTITRSFPGAGRFTISATGDPIADCCGGSGKAGSLVVEVECVPSKVVDRIAWEAEPIHKFFDSFCIKAKEIPFVKECSVSILVGGGVEIGEECCPGASGPTPYKKIKIDCKVKANVEAFIPGLSAFGRVWFNARSPGWFGDPWQLFAAKAQWNLGAFGGLRGESSILADEIKFGECGNCLTVTIGGKIQGTVGVAGKLSYDVWLGDSISGDPSSSAEATLQGSANTAVNIDGSFKIGSAKQDCVEGFTAQCCWDGFQLEVGAKLKIKGFGSWTYAKSWGPFASGCK